MNKIATTTTKPIIIVGVKYKSINLAASLIKKTSENISGVPRKWITIALASDKKPHKNVTSENINTFRLTNKTRLILVRTIPKLTEK